jgi:hypothetical protein
MSEGFVKSVEQLPAELRLKAWEVIDLLLRNPGDPILELKEHKDSTREHVYECRINDDYRLVLLKHGDGTYALVCAEMYPESQTSDRLLERKEITTAIVGEERAGAFLYGNMEMPFTEMPVQGDAVYRDARAGAGGYDGGG